MERIDGPASFLPDRDFYFREKRDPRLMFHRDQAEERVTISFEYRFETDELPIQARIDVPHEDFKSKIYQLLEGDISVTFEDPRGKLQLRRGKEETLEFSMHALTDYGQRVYISQQIPGVVLDRF